MPLWYYQSDDSTEHGPFSPTDLLELIRKGLIRQNTLVRKGTSAWVASTEINGLWEAAKRPSVEFACPHCGKKIPKPPVQCKHCKNKVQHAVGHLVHHGTRDAPPAKSASRRDAKTPFGARPGLYD